MRVTSAVWPLVLLFLTSCTTTSFKSEVAQRPPAEAATIAVGPITAKDEEMWHGYAVTIRRGLAEQLTKLRGADRVVLLAPGTSLPNGMTISGELTEFEKGDIALRWIIGFGAGQARATSRFQVADPAGVVLARFTTSKAYSGGAGMGGADLMGADDLARQLGEKGRGCDRWLA